MSAIVQYLTPSSGEEDPQFAGKIRVTDDGKISIYDALACCGFKNPHDAWGKVQKSHEEVLATSENWKFPGARQRDTPVTDRKGLTHIIMLLPGKIAARFRDKVAVLLERYLDADRSLAEDILKRADEREGALAVREHPRIQSCDSTKELNASIKAYADHHQNCGIMYPVVHDTNNLAVTGKTAAQLKRAFKAPAGSSRDLNTRIQSAAMAFLQLAEAQQIKDFDANPIQVAKRTRELFEPGFRATGLHGERATKECVRDNARVMRLNRELVREARLLEAAAPIGLTDAK